MLKRAVVVCAFVVGQILAPAAVTANETIEQAVVLSAANATVSGTLVGNSGGAFRYYAFDYAGGGTAVPLVMRAQPGRGTAGIATGFNVYGPAGLVGEAIGDDRSLDDSTYTYTLAGLVPGRYFVQVFNYIHGMPMNFQLTVQGLGPALAPAAPAAGPATPTNASPDRAVSTQQTSLTTGGLLTGTPGGNFAYFDLDYPGGRAPMTITLGYSPTTPVSEEAIGFNLYRRDPSAPGGAVLVAQSGQTGRDERSATEGFTFQADAAERLLLQVFNYLDGVTVNYTLIATGLAGPVANIGDVSSPGNAFVLSAAQPAARGTLIGDRSGRFHFFLLPYPGGDREVKITVTAQPNPEIGEGMFGFNLYKDADRVGTAQAGLDDKGRRTATIVIKESEARTFGIQVYNYSPGQAAQYSITVTGL